MHCESVQFRGLSRDGGFADLLKTNARSVVKLDPVLGPKDIAALADAGSPLTMLSGSQCPYSTQARRPWSSVPGVLDTSASSALMALTAAEIMVTGPNEKAL